MIQTGITHVGDIGVYLWDMLKVQEVQDKNLERHLSFGERQKREGSADQRCNK